MVTCLDASAMAPTMRSCSVSTSDGVDDLRVDRHRHHFAAALHGDLHQAAAGLTVHLGVGQRFLRLHQLLLHLLRLREECRHVGLCLRVA